MNTTDYWKDWFDTRAANVASDFVLNRGTSVQIPRVEEKARRQLLAAVSPLPTDVVLDAGCGSGRNISLFSPKVKAITGLDYSNQMLARANARRIDEGLINVTLIQGSLTKLPMRDSTFDKVLCTSVLQYLDDDDCRCAITELFRVAKSGATIVLHIKNGHSVYGASKRVSNAILGTFRRPVFPERYRSLRWHESQILNLRGRITGFDSTGILSFVRMPPRLLKMVLSLELRLPDQIWIKRYGVNQKLTIRVSKPTGSL